MRHLLEELQNYSLEWEEEEEGDLQSSLKVRDIGKEGLVRGEPFYLGHSFSLPRQVFPFPFESAFDQLLLGRDQSGGVPYR